LFILSTRTSINHPIVDSKHDRPNESSFALLNLCSSVLVNYSPYTYQENRILWYISLEEHFVAMHLSSLTAAMLLPFLAYAQTTTLTSTMTKTITVSEVVGTVTSTVGVHVDIKNATTSAFKIASTGAILKATSVHSAGTTATSSVVAAGAASTTAAFTGSGATLSSSHLTVAGLAALVAAAML